MVVFASIYDPPFKEYLYVVMAEPPFDSGAVNASVICSTPAVSEVIVGEPG